MPGQNISIDSRDGNNFSAYFSEAGSIAPAVIVIQEIFGVTDYMRQTADQLAAAGFNACIPDLFWRIEPGIQLDPSNEQERARAMEFNQHFDQNKGMDDLLATLDHLRADHVKVGSVGYCLGGRLSYLMAIRSNTDCNVGYYGVGIDHLLEESEQIDRPLMLHIAKEDYLCLPEAQAAIQACLGDVPKVALYTYANAGHGFANPRHANFNEKAASLANERTVQFLTEHLSSNNH